MNVKWRTIDGAIEGVVKAHNGEFLELCVVRHVLVQVNTTYNSIWAGMKRMRQNEKIFVKKDGNVLWIGG